MKTIIIYDSYFNGIKFSIVDGDYSRFNGVEINSNSHELEHECSLWLFDQVTGDYLIDFVNSISLLESKEWDKVAIIRFLP